MNKLAFSLVRIVASRCLFAAALAAIVISVGVAASPATAQQSTASQLSPLHKSEIEALVREYILENPEIILEAIQTLQNREARQQEEQTARNLERLRKELEYDRSAPVGGNPDGDVVIVEFFDYRCPYCKRVGEWVMDLIKEDGNIRYVFREFPILGETSVLAAQVALAAWEIDRSNYPALHDALMNMPGNLTDESIYRTVARFGYDVEKVKALARTEDIQKLIARNYELARSLQITGTPGFVVNGTIVRGAVAREVMQKHVAEARKAKVAR